MSTLAVAAITPKSQTGGVSDVQGGVALVAATSTPFVVGVRTMFRISLSGATDAVAAAGVHIRFGLTATPTAAATDFFIPPASTMDFDTGEEFDRFALISAGTPTPYIMRLNRAG